MKLKRHLYPLHSWLGVGLALLVFILCVSGSLAVFKDELDHWVAGALAAPPLLIAPDWALAELSVPMEQGQRARRLELPVGTRGYELRSQNGERYRFDAGGSVVPVTQPIGIADFLVNYHTRLFMGHPGRWLIGGVGVLFLVSIVSGVLMHRRLFRQLFTLRWRRTNIRLAFSDSHKAAGVWGLPFHLVIGITGAWLGLYGLIGPNWSPLPPEPDTLSACESPLTLACVMSETRRAIPGFSPVFVDFGKDGSTVAVRGNLPGQLFRRHEAGAVYTSATGQPIVLNAPGRMPIARRLDLAAAPLHFGDFAGVGVKWLYAVLGLLGATLTVTGVLMWSRRGKAGEQRKRQVAARVFCALAGGNLVATLALPLLALLAVGGLGPGFSGSMRLSDLMTPEVAPVLPVFLLLWLVATAGLTIIGDLSKVVKTALGLAGLCLVLAPVAAMVLRYRTALDLTDVLLHPTNLAVSALGLITLLVFGIMGFRSESATFSTEALSQRGQL